MKYTARKPVKKLTTAAAALLSSLVLSACGGAASTAASVILSGVGGTGIGVGGTGIGVGGTGIVFGAITGFGSVYVNEDRFITRNSKFIVDGEELDQSALAVGMVVRLEVETEDGQFTGDATRVVYDDEVQGPIDSTLGITDNPDGSKTFYVFGQKITVDEIGTRFVDTTFAAIDVDEVVEIRGFRISESEVSATYVRKTGDLVLGVSEVELRGTIENYVAGPPESFEIDGITIDVDRSNPDLELEVPNGELENDLYVEVKGIIQSPTTIEAREIELEDEDFGEEAEDVRIQGIISNYVDDSNFTIDGQLIDATGAEFEPPGAALGNGIEVEVEGDISGGVLFADEIEIEEEESKLRSLLGIVEEASSRFEVQFPVAAMPSTVVVNVDDQTVFEDETGLPLVTAPFSLDDLNDLTDYVIVEGTEVNDEIRAKLVKRIDPEDERRLEGIVDAYQPGISITILGVEYGLNGLTVYESNPAEIEVGDFVEIGEELDAPNYLIDGIADEVEESD